MPEWYKGKRHPNPLMKPYKPLQNTKGREFMNTILFPRFAKRFKDGDVIINIGKHWFWDYSFFFNNFELRCDYQTTDNDATQLADIVDDITDTKIPENSADGVIYVGMSDIGVDNSKAIPNCFKILKPGGRFLVSFHCGGTSPLYKNGSFQGFLELLKDFVIDEIFVVYGDSHSEMYVGSDPLSYFAICRKPL